MSGGFGQDGPEGEPEDLYDRAYRWGWDNPELRELVYLCYKTPDLAENARRFRQSEEFLEAARILVELGQPPGPGRRALDFGCGNGVASHALARVGYDVLGVDSSSGELAGLGAARRIQGLDGASFPVRAATGEALDFEDASFDVVWMREVLHHIRALGRFLGEVRRVLRPSGIVCCLRDSVIWNEEQRAHFFATHPFYPITRDEGCYYLEEYLAAFTGAGLRLERVLEPGSSPINSYPEPFRPGVVFDPEAARARLQGYDLFSFFAQRAT